MMCEYCGIDNPSFARFCGKCGKKLDYNRLEVILGHLLRFLTNIKNNFLPTRHKAFSSKGQNKEFTLDKFKDLNLKPVSVVPITFINKFWVFFGVFLAIFILSFFFTDLGYRMTLNAKGFDLIRINIFISVLLIINVVIVFYFLRSIYRKQRFKHNADYIESAFMYDVSRIAKDCKLGLFNNTTTRVLLCSKYDSIEKFDDKHLIIKAKGNQGLYSIDKRRLIIPVAYVSISSFHNSVASAKDSDGIVVHYDMNGKRLK